MTDDQDATVRILLVDDNVANLVALESVLEPLGQELVLARSGREALEKLTEECALVLMDVHMPVLDGFQTVEAIRRRRELAHLPVMFLTAMFRDPESAARGYALGAVDFILKPFEPDVIRAKVGAFVALFQYHERLKRNERLAADEVATRLAAEQANRMKEEFIAVLGHDLRSPLDTIMMLAESEPTREASERIKSSAGSMGRMIERVVDFTRTRLGNGIPIRRSLVDMGELCRAPLDEIRTIHPSVVVELEVHGNVEGYWDSDRVLQVVANLVGNAAKHGNGLTRISLRGTERIVALEVHNGGPAIPPDKMAHLFEPFYPGGRRREGLGLGLYIVEQIVRAHGGSVRAESSEAAGTTFTVYWPRLVDLDRA